MNDDNDENDEKYSNGWMREEVSIEALKNEIKTKEKKQTNLSIFARGRGACSRGGMVREKRPGEGWPGRDGRGGMAWVMGDG